MSYDLESPRLHPVKVLLQQSLEEHKLDGRYKPDDILIKVMMQQEEQSKPGTIDEIEVAWLKTAGLEAIKKIDRERAANKRNFIKEVKPLFRDGNPSAHRFYAGIAHKLYQFRLSQTYEVREIITEAVIRGLDLIESGEMIGIPLAWLRTTCFNVIRDLRRKQDRAENPKLDPTACEPGDAVFAEILLQEDLAAMKLAMTKLTPDEQQLLHDKILKELTWQQISESLSLSGESPVSHGTTRQRGSRAIKKLRQYYEAIRDDVKLTDEDNLSAG
jgi:RNA polymerase sigma factor (sigma-70 family)